MVAPSKAAGANGSWYTSATRSKWKLVHIGNDIDVALAFAMAFASLLKLRASIIEQHNLFETLIKGTVSPCPGTQL
jgi:hypothetical protein